MMMVHPEQADTSCKNSCMTCRSCDQLPLYVNGIDTRINNQILKNPRDILVHLVDLDNGRKPKIGTLKK